MDKPNQLFQQPRDYLLLELERRQSRNHSYSLRAFARDLSIAPSTLSEVMKGHYGLSTKKAESVAAILGLTLDQTEHFIDLFQRQFGQKRAARRSASQRIQSRKKSHYNSLAVDAFRAVADWYHMALLEFLSVNEGRITDNAKNMKLIAKKLEIEPAAVSEALVRLERLDQVYREDGEWVLAEEFTATASDVPSEAIRSFHKQVLMKALHSIENHELEAREISTTIFSFKKSEMKEAKKALKDFRREFGERFGTGKKTDSVFALGLQFFPLIATLEDSDD